MHSFSFYCPTKYIFGKEAQLNTPQEIKNFGGSRVLIVYGGKSAVKSGLLSQVEGLLSDAGLPYETIGGVKPNPRLSLAYEGIKKALAFGADFILAVGGGSVIDTAKAIAHGTASPDIDIWDFWLKKETVKKSLPVGCILTISAAGSESSDSSVLTKDEGNIKRGLNTDFNRPKFAIMNPELTFTLPPYQVACGVVDIMMHTMDRYFTPKTGNQLTDEIAEGLLRTVIKNGAIACKNPTDYEAMSELMWCGSISHNGLTGLGGLNDFAPHQLGHELSGMFDVAHGASLATMWPSWARYAYQENPDRFSKFARNVWGIDAADPVGAALAGIDATVSYFKSIGMPTNFSELGIGVQPDSVIEELADRSVFNGQRTFGSFKVFGKREAYEVYSLANR